MQQIFTSFSLQFTVACILWIHYMISQAYSQHCHRSASMGTAWHATWFCPTKHTWGPPCHVKVTCRYIYIYTVYDICHMPVWFYVISTPFETTPPPERHHWQLLRAWSIKGFWARRPSRGGADTMGPMGTSTGVTSSVGAAADTILLGGTGSHGSRSRGKGLVAPRLTCRTKSSAGKGPRPPSWYTAGASATTSLTAFAIWKVLGILAGGAPAPTPRWQLPSTWSTTTGTLKMKDVSWFGEVRGPNIYSFKAVAPYHYQRSLPLPWPNHPEDLTNSE